jgi:hypothetical protein
MRDQVRIGPILCGLVGPSFVLLIYSATCFMFVYPGLGRAGFVLVVTDAGKCRIHSSPGWGRTETLTVTRTGQLSLLLHFDT